MSEKLDLDYQSIGRRLQRRRIELEMTQAKLAEITDLSVPYISQIESGKKSARMSTLVSIANALGLSMDEIFAENVNKAEFVLKTEQINKIKSSVDLSDVEGDIENLKLKVFIWDDEMKPIDKENFEM